MIVKKKKKNLIFVYPRTSLTCHSNTPECPLLREGTNIAMFRNYPLIHSTLKLLSYCTKIDWVGKDLLMDV